MQRLVIIYGMKSGKYSKELETFVKQIQEIQKLLSLTSRISRMGHLKKKTEFK